MPTGIQKTYVLDNLTMMEFWVLSESNICPFWELPLSPSHDTHGWQLQHGAGLGAAAPGSLSCSPAEDAALVGKGEGPVRCLSKG